MGDIEFPPLVGWKGLLKGILGGSLLVGGLSNSFGLAIQAILFIFGLFIILDGIMVSGKGVFIIICLIGAVVFGTVTLVLSVAGLGVPYMLIIFIGAVILYYEILIIPAKRVFRQGERKHSGPEGVS